MNRLPLVLLVSAFLAAPLAGCVDFQGSLEPLPGREPAVLSPAGSDSLPGEETVGIAIPRARVLRGLRDPETVTAVLSLLPEALWERLVKEERLYVGDPALAAAIAAAAGIEEVDVAGGLWIIVGETTWGCIKCCFDDGDPCVNCPGCACCSDPEKRKDGFFEAPGW